jgi:MFS family permease
VAGAPVDPDPASPDNGSRSAPPGPPLNPTASIFRHRAYRLFWFARVAGIMGYQMLAVAVGWQVYELTRSALDLGLVGLVQFLPSVVLLLAVGHVADRHDRRSIVRLCVGVEAVAALVLAAGSVQGWISETAIFAVVFVIGAARAFEMPTMAALLPALVPPAELPRAVATNATAAQTAIIAGPAIGGFVYVAGPAAVYATCALLFATALVLLTKLRYDHVPPPREPTTLRTLFAGIGFIRRQPVMLGAISLDLFAVFLGGATALLPIYARDILDTGAWGLGLLRAAGAIGALVTALFLARRPLGGRTGRTMFVCVATFGAATVVFGLSTVFLLSFAALVVMGAADMVSVVIRSSLVQLSTPDAMRGRVSAVNSVFIGASNQLGEFESGVTAAWFGAVPAVVIGGVGTLLVVGVWMRLFPALARYDRLVVPARH